MKFAATFLAFVSVASAFGDIPLNSKIGKRLLEKATVVHEARILGGNDYDMSFMGGYAIKYLGCSGLVQVNAEGQGNNNNGESILSMNNLVRFALCPADACSACTNGGEYVTNMNDFIDAYTEQKLTEQEYTCEYIRENCDCENANDDDACEANCYTNEGHEECIEYEGQDDFEIQKYLECGEFEQQNNNNNNNNGYYQAYYIGAYCSPQDGKSIHMGIFTDAGCVTRGDSDVFYKSYGTELPYHSASMVSSECISCADPQGDVDGDGNVDLIGLCQETYERAAKCETNLPTTYPDTSACDYIQNILPRLEAASRSVSGGSTKTSSSSGSTAATAMACVFAATTIMFGAYAYFLYSKIKRGSVSLAAQDLATS